MKNSTKKHSKYFQLVILFIIQLFWITTVAGKPEDREIIYNIGAEGWAPYNIIERDGKISGIMPDVLRIIAAKYGIKVTITTFPSKRGALFLESGRVDARPKAKEWVKEPEKFIWTDPILNSVDVLIFLKDKKLDFKSLNDLIGKRIGTHFGYGYPTMEPFFASGKIERWDSHSQIHMLQMVAGGRTDAAIANKFVALWLIKKESRLQGRFDFSEKNIAEAGYRFMCTPKHYWQPFVDFFNKELIQMKEDGRLARIIEKYL